MSERMPRIGPDGPSPLQQLKALSVEEQEFLLEQKTKKVSAVKLIAQIEARHRIFGLTESRLSDFWRWLRTRIFLRQENEDVETFREEFIAKYPGSSWKEAHLAAVCWLKLKAGRTDNEDLMALAVAEMRKAMVIEQNEEKLSLDRSRMEVITCRLFLKWFQDARTREIAESNASNADKIAQLREFYFSDVDALEKTGEVQLPA